jgi:hypothetical protein
VYGWLAPLPQSLADELDCMQGAGADLGLIGGARGDQVFALDALEQWRVAQHASTLSTCGPIGHHVATHHLRRRAESD